MTAPASKLLQPITVGPLELKNRIMFPPLTTGYEERDGSIGERSLAFYERLARGGVSYIVIGDVAPVMTASPTPKLATDAQIPTFKALADAVHKHGAKVALQLFHPEYDVPGVGRMVMGSMAAAKAAQEAKAAGDEETFAAKMAESNEIRKQAYAKLHHDMQHFVNEASVEQLTQIKEAIAASAARAQQAGIDAIEVHGDRLVGSLCSAILNQRTDEYGGSFENRVRYALEVVAAIKEAAPQLMVEYKLPVIMENPDGTPRGKGGLQPDEACEFAKLLEGAGIDMIQVAQANHTGNMGDTIPPMGAMPYNWTLPVAERVKALVSVPVATVGRVVSVEAGEKILEDGSADIIAYGRSLMCDPDIALKAATGEPIRECLNCNKGCVDAIQNRKYISCVLNAENGDEATIAIKPGEGDKKIAVVGGGIAGLEAARVAAKRGYDVLDKIRALDPSVNLSISIGVGRGAKRGYDVTVYEASDHLGGQIVLAAAPPRKDEIMRSVEYYEKILPGLGVKVELNHAASPADLNAADAAIVAVGAHDVVIPVPGADSEKVVSSWDVLAGKVELGGRVAVIGGGLVGTETAEYLLQHGCEVAIVEMLDKIAAGESETILPLIMSDFAEHNVEQHVKTRLTAITDEGVEAIRTTEDGAEEPVKIACDYVVMAVGSKANAFDLDGVTVPVTCVGDCSGERTADIASAIRTAYHAANEL